MPTSVISAEKPTGSNRLTKSRALALLSLRTRVNQPHVASRTTVPGAMRFEYTDAFALFKQMDGGGLDDLLGFAAIGRHRKTREWLLWTHAWAHPSVLTRRQSVAANFHDFAKDNNLTLVSQIQMDAVATAGCREC